MATLFARLLDCHEAASHHYVEVHQHVQETCRDVIEAKLVPRFWSRHKIGKAEQVVCEYEDGDLVKRFQIVHEV